MQFQEVISAESIRILFLCMNLSLFDIYFIQEISVVITSSYQAIQVSPFTKALIRHIYA